VLRIKPFEVVPRGGWIQWGIIEHGSFKDEEEFFIVVWFPSYGYVYQPYMDRDVWAQRGLGWLGKRGFRSISRPVTDI
jgi:hypothetical protein